MLAACSGTSSTDSTTAQSPLTPSDELGLIIESVDFEADTIALRNAGNVPIDLTGFWLCNRPSYTELPSQEIGPGEVLPWPASSIDLSPEGGEVAVYSRRAFGDREAIVAYVAWGSAGQGRQSVAASAGLWPTDDFVDNAGAAIHSITEKPLSSDDWATR